MTNREKLIQTNIYDLLCRISSRRFDGSRLCIFYLLGERRTCPLIRCEKCIESWLNEEARP